MLRMVYVTPDGGRHWVDSTWRETSTLHNAVANCAPGDLIRLMPGNYFLPEPVDIPISGLEDQPIIIRGEYGAILEGRRPPDPEVSAIDPGCAKYAAFRIIGKRHIRLDNIRIERAWPSAVYIRDSNDLIFKNLQIRGGTYAFYATGEHTSRIIIENCDWIQDDVIWRYLNWAMIHDGEITPGKEAPYRYLNGAFFGADDIAGDIVIRGNDVRHCYNAVRMDVSATNLQKPIGSFNRNVRIIDNRFSFVRDNPIEPEATAVGWWVAYNQFYNCHKLFSQDNLAGGYWYYFGNRGWFDSRPGPEGDENNGGAVFKFGKSSHAQPSMPFECFHNSFFLRQKYVKKGATRMWQNRRNAIGYANPATLPINLMPLDQTLFGPTDELDLGRDEDLCVRFSGDVCNHATYPAIFDAWPGVLSNPRPAAGPIFKAGICGDLELVPEYAEGFRNPLEVPMPDGTVWKSDPQSWPGALTGKKLFNGPDYVPVDLAFIRTKTNESNSNAGD